MMMTVLRIAFRNTKRQKKRSFLLGGAIAFGVMVITLINAFTAGMVENVKGNFSYVLGGHIFLGGSELTDSGRIINAISDTTLAQEAVDLIGDKVEQVNKRSQAFGRFIFGSKETMQQIDGVDWEAESNLAEKLIVRSGSLAELDDPVSIVLAKSAADKLGVEVGEQLLVTLNTVTGQQNVGEFRLIAIIEDQTSFGVSTSYAHLAFLNELIGLKTGEYQSLHIFLKDLEEMDSISAQVYTLLKSQAEVEPRFSFNLDLDAHEGDDDEESDHSRQRRQAMRRLFGGSAADEDVEPWEGTKFSVTTLNDIMEPVMAMVGVLDTVALVVFLILLLITMVGIMNTFRMIMIERTQEIGTMRAFGMQNTMVRNIFLSEAMLIGVGGALAGLAISIIAMVGLSLITFTALSPLQFFLHNGQFTFQLVTSEVGTNLLILLLLTLFAAYLPARKAARLRPADALRAQY